MPPVLGMGSCADNSRILIAAAEMVKGDGLEEVGYGKWGFAKDPHEMAQLMIAHIDKKRIALGIDKARERVLMDMTDRRALEAA